MPKCLIFFTLLCLFIALLSLLTVPSRSLPRSLAWFTTVSIFYMLLVFAAVAAWHLVLLAVVDLQGTEFAFAATTRTLVTNPAWSARAVMYGGYFTHSFSICIDVSVLRSSLRAVAFSGVECWCSTVPRDSVDIIYACFTRCIVVLRGWVIGFVLTWVFTLFAQWLSWGKQPCAPIELSASKQRPFSIIMRHV